MDVLPLVVVSPNVLVAVVAGAYSLCLVKGDRVCDDLSKVDIELQCVVNESRLTESSLENVSVFVENGVGGMCQPKIEGECSGVVVFVDFHNPERETWFLFFGEGSVNVLLNFVCREAVGFRESENNNSSLFGG
jgi:hypothetical protein